MREFEIGDDGTYSEISKTLPAIPEGKGRVFLYMLEGGASLANTYGVAPKLTIDNYAYRILGDTFFYIDLKIGKHLVTASKINEGDYDKKYSLGEN
ncbi:MAG: hypothetical protein WBH40_02905, partial [Ignavibacteriaceae bacterium]